MVRRHIVLLFCIIVFEPRGGFWWAVSDLRSSQGDALVWGLADQRGVGPHRPTVLLLMVTASLPVPLTFLIFLPYATVCGRNWLIVECVWWLSSVPDLSEYRVWLGVSDIWKDSPDFFNRQEIRIAHVICGPEGSSLALIRLSQSVSENHWYISIVSFTILSPSLHGYKLIRVFSVFIWLQACPPCRQRPYGPAACSRVLHPCGKVM